MFFNFIFLALLCVILDLDGIFFSIKAISWCLHIITVESSQWRIANSRTGTAGSNEKGTLRFENYPFRHGIKRIN